VKILRRKILPVFIVYYGIITVNSRVMSHSDPFLRLKAPQKFITLPYVIRGFFSVYLTNELIIT